MNTPAHLILGLTAFGKAGRPAVTGAALVGALLPDASLYLLAGTHLFVLGTEPDVVFGQLYFSDSWQTIFSIDNSIILWGIALIIGLLLKAPVLFACSGAAMLHLVLDFALHHDDGRAHFWPISDWIFQSPVSYWDPAHYGGVVAPIELVIALACCVLLWRRYASRWMRALIASLAAAQTLPVIAWVFFFGS